jgi:hypothetical protein
MNGLFKYEAPRKLRNAIVTLASPIRWRRESGASTDAKSSDDHELHSIFVASAEPPGDGFEWRPA